MKFIANTDAFAHALRETNAIVRKGMIEATNGLLIEAADGVISVTATDMDRQFTKRFDAAKIDEPGAAIINAPKITSLVGAMPEGSQTELTVKDGGAVLVCGRSRYRLGALAASDFPRIPFSKAQSSFAMDARTLAAALSTRHAAADAGAANMRHLYSVYLHEVGGHLHMAASDGTRLARWALDTPATPELSVLLSLPALSLLEKFGGDVAIEFSGSKMRVQNERQLLIASLIDGTFPENYQRLIPTDHMRALIDADALSGALARIDLVCGETDKMGKIIGLTFSDNLLSIKPTRAGVEDGAEEIVCEYAGEGLRVALGSRYLRDALDAINADSVEIGVIGPQAPVIITAPARPEAAVVIMSAAA